MTRSCMTACSERAHHHCIGGRSLASHVPHQKANSLQATTITGLGDCQKCETLRIAHISSAALQPGGHNRPIVPRHVAPALPAANESNAPIVLEQRAAQRVHGRTQRRTQSGSVSSCPVPTSSAAFVYQLQKRESRAIRATDVLAAPLGVPGQSFRLGCIARSHVLGDAPHKQYNKGCARQCTAEVTFAPSAACYSLCIAPLWTPQHAPHPLG
eukprot:TRINITY_DN24413_c0_g1_i2.p1 TRINITY_DN24413_c0_g1~~TRINITY_DN24413_c0_g1_i2.p1  ORF type:complete len:247 (+),score=3.64 TRINITY_DN24413_c0_g1_i2:103-741(+)